MIGCEQQCEHKRVFKIKRRSAMSLAARLAQISAQVKEERQAVPHPPGTVTLDALRRRLQQMARSGPAGAALAVGSDRLRARCEARRGLIARRALRLSPRTLQLR